MVNYPSIFSKQKSHSSRFNTPDSSAHWSGNLSALGQVILALFSLTFLGGCAGGVILWQEVDADGDGAIVCQEPNSSWCAAQTNLDCDDSNDAVNPGAIEVCNAIDDNCDATVDEGFDTDGDGYTSCGADCNDTDALIYPGATEVCNGIDDNCDATLDEGFDTDGDGYTSCGADCNDTDALIYPGATEVCDGVDNNCDGDVDGWVELVWFLDDDGDGFGDEAAEPVVACQDPGLNYTDLGGDCEDTDSNINPDADEVCDSIDNNCNGETDEVGAIWYPDSDSDQYGGSLASDIQSCAQPQGYTTDSTDCDDNNPVIYPSAEEVCDALDNDCDESVDENLQQQPFYQDLDQDGFGNSESGQTAWCVGAEPAGYVLYNTDCNDDDPSISPAAPEACDSMDNDCDTEIDETCWDSAEWDDGEWTE